MLDHEPRGFGPVWILLSNPHILYVREEPKEQLRKQKSSDAFKSRNLWGQCVQGADREGLLQETKQGLA